MAPRETENNGYAKFWGDKEGALWYVMVFSGVVNCYLAGHAVDCKFKTFLLNKVEVSYKLSSVCFSSTRNYL